MAYKCPETLGNKGLSGTLFFDEKAFATFGVKITKEQLRQVTSNEDLEYVWEAGEIQLFVGHDSNCSDYKSIELVN